VCSPYTFYNRPVDVVILLMVFALELKEKWLPAGVKERKLL